MNNELIDKFEQIEAAAEARLQFGEVGRRKVPINWRDFEEGVSNSLGMLSKAWGCEVELQLESIEGIEKVLFSQKLVNKAKELGIEEVSENIENIRITQSQSQGETIIRAQFNKDISSNEQLNNFLTEISGRGDWSVYIENERDMKIIMGIN